MSSKYKSNRDGYLQRKFGITEAEFLTAFKEQGEVCKTCGSSPGTNSLHVDHDHAIAGWKILSTKIADKIWEAWPENGTGRLAFKARGRTKPEARRNVKLILKRLSVRGILCWGCNAGLKKYQDDPIRIHKVAEYLDEYYAFVVGDINTRNGFGE